MDKMDIWEAEFLPYNTPQGKAIAGTIRATFTFMPAPHQVLEAIQNNCGKTLTPFMVEAILAKAYYLVKRRAFTDE